MRAFRRLLQPCSLDEPFREPDRQTRDGRPLANQGIPAAEVARRRSVPAPPTNTATSRAPGATPRRAMMTAPAHAATTPAMAYALGMLRRAAPDAASAAYETTRVTGKARLIGNQRRAPPRGSEPSAPGTG